jgi:hypothetical protein
MTKQEAQIRNYNIMQFRGCAKRVVDFIPVDILNKLTQEQRARLCDAKQILLETFDLIDESAPCIHFYEDFHHGKKKCAWCDHIKHSKDRKGKSKCLNL